MRIAYITHYFPPAGFAASINTYEIVKRLAARGHSIDVFTQSSYTKHTKEKENVPLVNEKVSIRCTPHFPVKLSVILPHIINVYKPMRCLSNYDLITTQFHPFHFASFSGCTLKSITGKPWVARVHDMFPDPSILGENIYQRIYYYSSYKANLSFLKKTNRIFVVTSEVRNLLVGKGFLPENIDIIPNGVDTNVFAPAKNKYATHQKTILYIGSMQPEDGLEILIKAFSILDPHQKPKLVLVGDGVQKSVLEAKVNRYRLKDKVTFLSYVPHVLMPAIIQRSYLTIGPLLRSPINAYTIPSKILEYFACGKPVISTQISKDALANGVTGLVLDSSDPRDLAKAILFLLENAKFSSRIGENARKLVAEKFDWEKIVDSLEDVMQEVAG